MKVSPPLAPLLVHPDDLDGCCNELRRCHLHSSIMLHFEVNTEDDHNPYNNCDSGESKDGVRGRGLGCRRTWRGNDLIQRGGGTEFVWLERGRFIQKY
jgi:hypothetical protein